MTTPHYSPWLRWSLIASLLVLIATVSLLLIFFPSVVTTAGAQAPLYLLLFVLAMFIYGWFALFGINAHMPASLVALRTGTQCGLACAAAWVIELLVANVISIGWTWLHLALYFGSALIGYVLPGLAGWMVAWRSRRTLSGLQAGLLTGMMGALAIFLASLFLSAVLLQAGQHDQQTLQEFTRSGLPDLQTYLVGDYLAGMIAHLWIGLITGFFLGLPGALVGKALAPLLPSEPGS